MPTHDPVVGAAEVRRAAAHPKFAAAHMFFAIGKPFGHSIYDPIYAAASEMDIPVYIHGSTGEIGGGAPPASGGSSCTTAWRCSPPCTIRWPIT